MRKSKIHYWLVVVLALALIFVPLSSALNEIIIIPKDKNMQKSVIDRDFDVVKKLETFNGYILEVSDEELASLKKDPRFYVQEDFVQNIQLDHSVSQINASDLGHPAFGGLGLNGAGESVCVIDTGIDRNHVAFQGRIVGEKCFCRITNADDGLQCCNDNTAEDDFAQDDHGHGTHVASIAVGNIPGLEGVAPGAGIVAVKTCSAGGSCSSSDVISAIDWCVAHKDALNISAISISIGSGTFSTHCDSNSPIYAAAVNAATAQNISVVAAAGNSGNSNAIMLPACLSNAIPVGSVDDYDTVWQGHNRGEILDLMAPGRNIMAARLGGGTTIKHGTSMATPHVSGSILLMNQLLHANDQEKTPSEIESIFDETGKEVVDPFTGLSYSRIDVLSALLTFDFTAPAITFTNDSVSNSSFVAEGAKIEIAAEEELNSAWIILSGSGTSIQLVEDRGSWSFVLPLNIQERSFPTSDKRAVDGQSKGVNIVKKDRKEDLYLDQIAQLSDVSGGIPETPRFTYRYRAYGQDLAGNIGVSEERTMYSRDLIYFTA